MKKPQEGEYDNICYVVYGYADTAEAPILLAEDRLEAALKCSKKYAGSVVEANYLVDPKQGKTHSTCIYSEIIHTQP